MDTNLVNIHHLWARFLVLKAESDADKGPDQLNVQACATPDQLMLQLLEARRYDEEAYDMWTMLFDDGYDATKRYYKWRREHPEWSDDEPEGMIGLEEDTPVPPNADPLQTDLDLSLFEDRNESSLEDPNNTKSRLEGLSLLSTILRHAIINQVDDVYIGKNEHHISVLCTPHKGVPPNQLWDSTAGMWDELGFCLRLAIRSIEQKKLLGSVRDTSDASFREAWRITFVRKTTSELLQELQTVICAVQNALDALDRS